MLQSKLPGVGTTIFTTMSAMAAEYNAINLSQGYPDFSPPEPLLAALANALTSGKNQYPPMTGIQELRHAVQQKVQTLYHCTISADTEVTVTSGATEALFVAIQALVQRGDEVIVIDPCYDAYEPAIQLAGGQAIHVPMTEAFTIDWNQVEANITRKTRVLMLNSPHNPSGSVLTKEDMAAVEQLAQKYDLWIISDEVYEHMVFDGAQHLSLLTNDTLRARSVVISSFGKTYHATGWKVGYAIAPAVVMVEFRKIHQFVTFTTHTPTQYALAGFMTDHPEHHEQLPNFYQQKRDLFLGLLKPSSFKMTASSGTYFQLADYSAISDLDDQSFATLLTQEVGVAAIPISVFYQSPPQQKIVRFCFAKDDETLQRAAEKLVRFSEHCS